MKKDSARSSFCLKTSQKSNESRRFGTKSMFFRSDQGKETLLLGGIIVNRTDNFSINATAF